MTDKLRIAVVGAGYWGPNLARNFRSSPDWELGCHLRPRPASGPSSSPTLVGGVPVITDLDAVAGPRRLDAVAIATPARTHHDIALAALRAGKHVLVEKPLADARRTRAGDGATRPSAAASSSCATTPTATRRRSQKIRELIQDGALGDILFVDSVRINLGLVQPDVDVFWDLAPHDLSILDFVLPGGLRPPSVVRPRRRPDRRRPGLRRLPDDAAAEPAPSPTST